MPPPPQWRVGRRELRRYARGSALTRSVDGGGYASRRSMCLGPRLVLHATALAGFAAGLYFVFF